ncbi:hypothetical protein SAMN05421858_0633 [Haladaptatus litoreus]|uniref:Uncharacterized protein n=1 Tax=Haladaptatus litoreus TaxID=553468 RepID=A0A1N6W8G3_9EURY|nr:hypothetical protein [Haladaptatus litoreus]SIQ86312.1 hypothetical protein SAMN05421858_0633 [Haladaptatus litoreus]
MKSKTTRKKRAKAWAYVHFGLFGGPDEETTADSEDEQNSESTDEKS